MPYSTIPSPPPASGHSAERFFSRLMGWLTWGVLACLGLVFALSLLVWMLVMVVVSLLASVVTGRPAAVTLLWRRYRDLTRGFARSGWARQGTATSTPRADAAAATGAAQPRGVQDVNWRDLRSDASAHTRDGKDTPAP